MTFSLNYTVSPEGMLVQVSGLKNGSETVTFGGLILPGDLHYDMRCPANHSIDGIAGFYESRYVGYVNFTCGPDPQPFVLLRNWGLSIGDVTRGAFPISGALIAQAARDEDPVFTLFPATIPRSIGCLLVINIDGEMSSCLDRPVVLRQSQLGAVRFAPNTAAILSSYDTLLDFNNSEVDFTTQAEEKIPAALTAALNITVTSPYGLPLRIAFRIEVLPTSSTFFFLFGRYEGEYDQVGCPPGTYLTELSVQLSGNAPAMFGGMTGRCTDERSFEALTSGEWHCRG